MDRADKLAESVALMQYMGYSVIVATVTSELRRAIQTCGLSLNELARQSGIDVSVLSRFASGAELKSDNLDKLAGHFGYKLTRKARASKGR